MYISKTVMWCNQPKCDGPTQLAAHASQFEKLNFYRREKDQTRYNCSQRKSKKRNDFNEKKWRERRGSNPRPPA
jgi:hypothetical protein